MKKPQELSIKESLSELKKLRLSQPSLYKRKRVDCLIYIKNGKFNTRKELANYLGVHIRTQERWITKYKSRGILFMLQDEPKNTSSKIITQEIHQGLEARVQSSESPFLGYWDAQDWVNQQYGVYIKYHWLRKYLIQHFKTKLKSPRKSHYKKDEQAIEAFLKTP
ncbi:MAG: winged helix-turn-helix domain-containing protein [Bacteroidales bacterium]|jgi:transposase|nr:winged helix-turn-helix domain-containing protein [Bacteroidales bacterium]